MTGICHYSQLLGEMGVSLTFFLFIGLEWWSYLHLLNIVRIIGVSDPTQPSPLFLQFISFLQCQRKLFIHRSCLLSQTTNIPNITVSPPQGTAWHFLPVLTLSLQSVKVWPVSFLISVSLSFTTAHSLGSQPWSSPSHPSSTNATVPVTLFGH